ncbi:hypothetical protein JCM9140_4684 [Halalkalibacter wakoensis JCM 9140]|uniref:Uncharacterized protein n=1 Tax=Halalkalibacter wakoensis JCM 9140 TaxID=1236970 RepID=W4Q914_9BACI|nr:hypothetical protein JCM9140_4684 [Halalkalibacter wakoensis JCM 9140]
MRVGKSSKNNNQAIKAAPISGLIKFTNLLLKVARSAPFFLFEKYNVITHKFTKKKAVKAPKLTNLNATSMVMKIASNATTEEKMMFNTGVLYFG